MQGDTVVVESGLNDGERLVVTDLVPAIEGMLLNPTEDTALAEAIARQAAGGAERPGPDGKTAEQTE